MNKYYYYLLLAFLSVLFSTNSHAEVKGKIKAYISGAYLSDSFQSLDVKVEGESSNPTIKNEQGFGILGDITIQGSSAIFIDYYSLSEERSLSSNSEPKFSTSSFAVGYKYNFLSGLYLGGGFMFSDYNYEIDDLIGENLRYSTTYDFPLVTAPLFVLGYDYIHKSGFAVGVHLARTLRADVTADHKSTGTNPNGPYSFSGKSDFDDLVITTLGLGIGYAFR